MTREDQWMNRIEQGDCHAVEELIEAYYPEILRYCLWHAPNQDLAEDAAQETFLTLIRCFDRYTHKGKFKAFLYRIAANRCADLWRREHSLELPLEELTAEPIYEDPDLAAMELRQLVRGLPDELQEIVVLRFSQDLTLKEISQVVGLPMRTVQSRLRSALKQLKQEFTKGGQL